ncbi:MAG: helix-turn-helix domain-containing protein [Blastocatellia bacterium]
MKLGELLAKERERRRLTSEDVAVKLGLSAQEYSHIENGASDIERWGPRLAQFAIKLKAPTSRLISENGRSDLAGREAGQCGKLIKRHREQRGLSQQNLAELLEIPLPELVSIENGESQIETYAPLLLRFAELMELPIFNLFYPFGLPLEKVSEYP